MAELQGCAAGKSERAQPFTPRIQEDIRFLPAPRLVGHAKIRPMRHRYLTLLAAPACAVVLAAIAGAAQTPPQNWNQWGGPDSKFPRVPNVGGLADTWPASGPPVIWTRPLGTGHSAIVVDDGRLFTMYRTGNGRAKLGPWNDAEVVVALDAKTGATIWEHTYPARTGYEDFSFGPGPHATPLVVGDRVFTIGHESATVRVRQTHGQGPLVARPHQGVQIAGAADSPGRQSRLRLQPYRIPRHDHLQRRRTGTVRDGVPAVRRRGRVEERRLSDVRRRADPDPDRRAAAGRVLSAAARSTGLDPADGRILWSHPHDPGNDLNCSTPLFGPDNVLFVSSAYQAGSRAIQLTAATASITNADELWFTNRVRFMFLSAIRVGDFVYGTTGDFGPAFLTALNIKTGESAWQVRGFARASLLHGRRRQDDRPERRRRPGAGATVADRRRDSRARESLRHHVVDGADARRHDAVRARPREDRRAGLGNFTHRRIAGPFRDSPADVSRARIHQPPGGPGSVERFLEARRGGQFRHGRCAVCRLDGEGRSNLDLRDATRQRHPRHRVGGQYGPHPLLSTGGFNDDGHRERHDHDEYILDGEDDRRRRHGQGQQRRDDGREGNNLARRRRACRRNHGRRQDEQASLREADGGWPVHVVADGVQSDSVD